MYDDISFSLELLESTFYELKLAPDSLEEAPLRQIIGGCYVTDFGDWVELAALSINPSFRRKGIGTFLLKRIIQDYERTHAICLMVDTEFCPNAPMNPSQLAAWYHRLGFEIGSPYHEGEGWMSRIVPFFLPG